MSNRRFLDGPLQQQMMLMKLVHEMETRPDFGASFNNDPDSEIRLWLARIGAIMDRVSISRSISFRASLGTAVQYWQPAMRNIQIQVREAIEEMKLDLELYQDERIGKIYDAGQEYQFAKDILNVIESAESDLLIVDPYFDTSAFSMLLGKRVSAKVRILMGKGVEGVKELSRRYSLETGVDVEVRKSKSIHDRVVFINRDECWLVGSSIKDGGGKPTYLMPVLPAIINDKLAIYEGIWEQSREASQ